MMLRATQKIKEKIKLKNWDEEPAGEEVSFLSEWFVNLFLIGRKKYFIFSESNTLYSIILPNQDIGSRKDLEHTATDVVFSLVKHRDLPISLFEETCSKVSILKTNNRRIVGSQNDLIFMAQVEYAYNDICDFTKINSSPMKMLNYATPEDEFLKQLKVLIK
jgi:hypothetical protein